MMRRLLFTALCFSAPTAASAQAEEAKQPTAQQAEEFQQAPSLLQDFLDFDLNKDKQIDAQEVRTQFKGELDPKELHQFFIDVDQDLSGTISLQEYISYASSLHSDQSAVDEISAFCWCLLQSKGPASPLTPPLHSIHWLASAVFSQSEALLGGLSPTFAAVKSVKSALVVMPPVQMWDPIQQIRRGRDKGFFRWMPHINMLYPFLEDTGGDFEAAAARAREALQDVEPFTLQLQHFHFFEHSRRSCTVWLRVMMPLMQILQLFMQSTRGCWERFRLARTYQMTRYLEVHSSGRSRDIDKFVPHLSVGSWRGATEAAAAVEVFQNTWSSLSFPVSSVYFISRRNYNEPFQVRWAVPLGPSPAAPKELNLRYLARPNCPGGKDIWEFGRKRAAAGYIHNAAVESWALLPSGQCQSKQNGS
ncbi:unnamed protein product [Symbiodinium necroappetens]|uniref:EF-hand domain-containing protein n=1 Tax=Symbiodinium necroappetens TaxID=1628268 RepID=A0A812K5G5_9DINO|nr:unnamed protein product [Symbiodinium necroappetens]